MDAFLRVLESQRRVLASNPKPVRLARSAFQFVCIEGEHAGGAVGGRLGGAQAWHGSLVPSRLGDSFANDGCVQHGCSMSMPPGGRRAPSTARSSRRTSDARSGFCPPPHKAPTAAPAGRTGQSSGAPARGAMQPAASRYPTRARRGRRCRSGGRGAARRRTTAASAAWGTPGCRQAAAPGWAYHLPSNSCENGSCQPSQAALQTGCGGPASPRSVLFQGHKRRAAKRRSPGQTCDGKHSARCAVLARVQPKHPATSVRGPPPHLEQAAALCNGSHQSRTRHAPLAAWDAGRSCLGRSRRVCRRRLASDNKIASVHIFSVPTLGAWLRLLCHLPGLSLRLRLRLSRG